MGLLCGCSPMLPSLSGVEDSYILIDPGHGGFDGGTVADDGTVEKHINLSISLLLRDLLQVCGIPLRMTRDTDVGLNNGSEDTIRQKKQNDMQNRLALYNQAKVVISVHQNHFAQPQYSGAQIFYSNNHSDSLALANCLQKTICNHLQPENNREVKAASDGIFLLHHTTVPAVLVECGFLSNPNERQQLVSETYRQKMAFAIMTGYFQYASEK